MFNTTKYTNWYYDIIKKAKGQPRKKGNGIYYEKHHIIPKSIGGNDDKNNLVLLTAKEHYMCHLLLPKMCVVNEHKVSMSRAFFYMSNGMVKERYTSKIYDYVKKSNAKIISEALSGENCYMYGVPKTDEIKKKISQTRIKNDTGRGKNNPMYDKKHSMESKQLMSQNRKGKASGKDNGMFGKKRPDLSQHNKENRIPIAQYDKDMNLITVHESASVAAKKIGANTHRNINYNAANYKKYPNRTAYGFKWRYIE
jgi:hypothetical protein